MDSRRRLSPRFPRLAAITSICLVAAACGWTGEPFTPSPAGPEPGNPGASNTVTITGASFSPSILTVALGTTVSWVWAPCMGDGYASCPTHNVTFDDGSNIASGNRDNGQFTRQFSVTGTYRYHCRVHGTAMSGQVVVVK